MFDDINEIEVGGILPTRWLREAAQDGVIFTEQYKIPEANLQPASLDLRLGDRAHRLRCSFLPDAGRVRDKLPGLSMETIDLRDGAILERDRPYLVPLIEQLRLPPGIRGKANPKSSTGRLDIFTRVITDRSHRFDEIGEGYNGPLFLEVVSRSFTIKVKTGLALNQLRLIKSGPDAAGPAGDRRAALSANLAGDGESAGYRARKNSSLLDLSRERRHDPGDYWEPVYAEPARRLVLEPEEFYLLTSAERVRVPPEYAAEMTAYDPSSGELPTHYAGFFDPGFGWDRQGSSDGVQAVMEIRAHDVPFMIEHGQKVCTLNFERMLEVPDKLYGAGIGSSYQGQGLILSKHFVLPTGHRQLPLLEGPLG